MSESSASGELARIAVLRDAASFTMWSSHIRILFASKDLLGLVDGEFTIDEVPPGQEADWKEKDAQAKLYIIQTTAQHIKKHLLPCATSKDMYQKLKRLYEKDSDHQKNLLMEQLYAYKWDNSVSAIDNAGHISNLAYQLNGLGQVVNDVAVMSKIVSMLPSSLDHFSTAWDSVPAAEKTVENLVHRLQREEDKIKLNQAESGPAAFASYSRGSAGRETKNLDYKDRGLNHGKRSRSDKHDHDWQRVKKRRTCYSCGSEKHLQKDCKHCSICKKDNHRPEDCFFRSRFCGICKSHTHYQRDCRYRHKGTKTVRDREHHASRSHSAGRSEERHKKVCFMAGPAEPRVPKLKSSIIKILEKNAENEVSKPSTSVNCRTANVCSEGGEKPCSFVVDSGATGHFTNQLSLLSNVKTSTTKIHLAQHGAAMTSSSYGALHSKIFNLKKVLHVPDLATNLLSASEVANNHGAILLDHEGVKILRKTVHIPEELILLKGGRTPNGLFTVNLPVVTQVKNESVLLAESERQTIINWHRKMGHIGLTNLKKLTSMCNGLNMSDFKNLELICSVCAQAKMCRKPHNTVRQRATRPLQIVHSDVCGPIDPPTFDGKCYFLVVIDDFTHYCEVYLLEKKSEVFEHLKAYIQKSENSHQLKVSKIRCDNGGEYSSLKLKSWCRDKGITLDYTVPRTPQLDGTSERLNRTMLEKIRALLFDSNLAGHLWGEAAYTAAYLSNRSPSSTVTALPAELKKLQSRSQIAVMVGYAPHGYRLWDPETLN